VHAELFHAAPRKSKDTVAVLGIDIGKNVFHLIGLDKRRAIVLRQKLSREQLETRLAKPTRHRHRAV
jgi:transposase